MRLLVLSNLYPPHYLGGYELLCAEVATRLAARGHEVHVLTSTNGGARGEERQGRVSIQRALELVVPFDQEWGRPHARHLAVYRSNRQLTATEIARWRPDVVFAWSQLRLSIGPVRAAQEAGLPIVWALNDATIASYRMPGPTLSPRGAARWLIARTVMAPTTLAGIRFDHATVISHSLRADLVARGLPVEQAPVIPQGIDIDLFPPKDSPGSVGRPMRIVYTGQLHEYKGVHTAIEALRLLIGSRGPDAATLTIAGAGEDAYTRRLEQMAAGLPVEFRGRLPRTELPALYRAHDVFVFPSIWREPFGLTQLEAMASGLAVVATAEGGHGECLRHGENALVFPPGNAEALSAHLARLIDEPGLGVRLATAARAMVGRDYTLDRYTTSLESMLAAAAGVTA
jgi:glycosyltransferase involved in cell wall biosynthesis